MTTTDAMPAADPIAAGAGELNIATAAAAPTPVYTQRWVASQGTGTPEGARGSAHVADPVTGVALTGERDIVGSVWNARAWSTAALASRTWSSGTWSSGTWSSGTWSSGTWSAGTWSAGTWLSRTWSARTWSGVRWS